ncbi:MAG TPA: ABC transporter permease [Rhizomicrobium sp.]|nr:ABC transporter permease [Rhizomicrobium sp.]
MFHNYLVTAFRNIVRHKLYSFINIAGLTVGLTCAIFIILFVRDQLSYDRWTPETENLYRVESTQNLPGKPPIRDTKIAFPLIDAMLDQIPEIKARTRLAWRSATVLAGNRQFPETIEVVDPNFLQVIKLPLAAGNPAWAFARPESVVLSQATARKYFGDQAAIGKSLIIAREQCDALYQGCQVKQQALVVTGILRDLPHNTQLKAEVLVPNNGAAGLVTQEMRENWLYNSGWGYVLLAPGADPNLVMAKSKAIIDRQLNPAKMLNIKARGSEVLAPTLIPFRDVHLSTDRYGSMTSPGSWTMVYGFAAIGALILLIACFNFTNLATARAMMRAREISLRKVAGATRRQLIIQFLGESVLTAAISLVFALALTEIVLPLFGGFLGIPAGVHDVWDWQVFSIILAAGLAAGLLSGAYPALVLSAFRPASTMRMTGRGGRGLTRTALVVVQFAVSIGLGIAAVVIFAQISFSRNIDLGFRKEAVVVVKTNSIPPATAESMANTLKTDPGISDVAMSDAVPFSNDHNNISVHIPGASSSDFFGLIPASPDYMHLYGMRLLAGRLLSDQRGADGISMAQINGKNVPSFNVLVNATAARRLGYSPQEAIGKTLKLNAFGGAGITVVGIVADVKHDGPKKPVDGTLYMYWRDFPLGHLSVRIRNGHVPEALSFIDHTWHRFAPSIALQRHFLDDDYNKQFLADERQGRLFGVFVGVAIFIACLGLFGLAAFTAGRRTKEIGIRKVFGARTRDVVWLLLWQFTIPVLIANVIAWPVAWYYLHDWLQGFAYRIPLSPLYFVGAGGAAMLIAWATVFAHARRVAGANPIHALRYE